MKKRTNKRTLANFVFAVALFYLHSVYNVFAGDALVAPPDFKQVAQHFATVKYNGIIDDGIPYYSLEDEIVSWVFTVYQGTGAFPSQNDIKDSVFAAYELRRQAEAQYQAVLDAGDEEAVKNTENLIRQYWAQMRNSENFAAIFVMGDSTGIYKIVRKIILPP